MRLLHLFLVISLFMQPILAVEEQTETQQSFFDRAKICINAIASLGKQGFNTITSTEAQWRFLAPEIVISMLLSLIHDYDRLYLNATTSAVHFNELSPAIQEALRGMNAQDIAVKLYDGKNGFSLWNTICIGKEHSDAVQQFIVGHEIAHIQNNHLMKQAALSLAMIICCIGVNKIVLPKFKQTLQTTSKDSYTYKCILIIKNILSFFDQNPLITYILIKTISAHFSQYCEKQADMIAATTLNSAQGGIDFFNQEIINENTQAIELNNIKDTSESLIIRLLSHYFSAWLWLSRKLNWSSHPSLQTRIDYLAPLAY